MAEPFLSQITMFGGGFAARNYALCNGVIMSITQNSALFSLLGTTYGGNGVNTFALPNLQSSLPLSFGHAPGLSNYIEGQVGGTPAETLIAKEVPAHVHAFSASTSSQATTSASVGNTLVPGTPSVANAEFYANPPQPGQPPLIPVAMGKVCSTVGANQPHTNLMPSLCITFMICTAGVFPSRN